VKQLAAAAGLSVFDAAKLLYGLVATGLLRLKPAAAPPAAATAAPPSTAPAEAAAAAPQTAGTSEMLLKLARVKDVCNGLLGTVGESVVTKHYQKARAEIESGAGPEIIDEAISQIARAASILKGPSITKSLLEQLKTVR
jgi:hypothetical protein